MISKSKYVKFVVFISVVAIFLGCCIIVCSSCTGAKLNLWNQNSDSYKAITSFVSDATNKSSENFIPEEDRVVVFDQDGTIFGEKEPLSAYSNLFAYRVLHDPTYTCTDQKLIDAAKRVENCVTTKEGEAAVATAYSSCYYDVFAGLTLDEFKDCVDRFLDSNVVGNSEKKYIELSYKPMAELISYLQNNKFQVYVCTGSDRTLAREIASKCFNLPPDHVLAGDPNIIATNQGETNSMRYTMKSNDSILIDKGNTGHVVCQTKVELIVREIGKKPVLVFGNGSVDLTMMSYCANNNPYHSAVFMVLNNNTDTEPNVDLAEAEKMKSIAQKSGYNTISVKDDWTTIF